MYFAIDTATGGKYGPVDVATLRQWMAEGRITSTTKFEEAASGAILAAEQVPGLMQIAAPPGPAGQTPYQPIQTPYTPSYTNQMYSGDIQQDITWAWIFAFLSLLCCPLLTGILGILRASKVKNAGHPMGQTLLIVNIVAMIIGLGIGASLFRI